MSIYGIGASFEGKYNKQKEFISKGCACIGWEEYQAPALYKVLKKVNIGDLMYIKSMSIATKELLIKAVGVVTDNNITFYKDTVGSYLGNGVKVNWLWNDEKRIKISDEMYRYNVFNNTLYEEFNSDIQKLVVKLAFNLS
ncbi:MAG: hypothetical protein GXW91_11450 [Clostridiales bacterium]|nr:hypothetical protein [Clostridiales bacterium]